MSKRSGLQWVEAADRAFVRGLETPCKERCWCLAYSSNICIPDSQTMVEWKSVQQNVGQKHRGCLLTCLSARPLGSWLPFLVFLEMDTKKLTLLAPIGYYF